MTSPWPRAAIQCRNTICLNAFSNSHSSGNFQFFESISISLELLLNSELNATFYLIITFQSFLIRIRKLEMEIVGDQISRREFFSRNRDDTRIHRAYTYSTYSVYVLRTLSNIHSSKHTCKRLNGLPSTDNNQVRFTFF